MPVAEIERNVLEALRSHELDELVRRTFDSGPVVGAELEVRGSEPRGGWWGNSYPDVEGWELGSRLHVLTRGKATARQARLIEEEIRARLQCLVDDGIAASLDVEVSWAGDRWTALVGVGQDSSRVEWVQVWEDTI